MLKSLAAAWRENRKYAATVAFGVLLFELIEHLPAVGGFLSAFKKAACPVLWGLAAAYVIFMPVRFIETRLFKRLYARKRSAARAAAMILTYAALAGLGALFALLVAPRIIDAAAMLAGNAERMLASAKEAAGSLLGAKNGGAGEKLAELAEPALDKLKAAVPELLPRVLSFAMNAMGTAYSLLLAAVISVYAVARKERLLRQTKTLLTALLPPRARETLFSACVSANGVFRKYFAGQAASCLFVGALCYLGMRIASMPYPELISAFICAAALIPVVGPWISTVPSAFIILMTRQDKPMLALWFVIMILGIQLIDDNLIYPRVVGGAVGISGIWVLAAVLIGGGLFGLPGLFTAVPVTAVAYRTLGDWANRTAKEKLGEKADTPGP